MLRLLELNGLIKKIERYQDHEEKKVADRVGDFLDYLDSTRENRNTQETLEI